MYGKLGDYKSIGAVGLGLALVLAVGAASDAMAQSSRRAGGSATEQQRDENNPNFWLRNRSGVQIDHVNVSKPQENSWGRDRLGKDEVIQSGERGAIRLGAPGQCIWDVRVVYHDKREEDRRKINLCKVTELVFDGSEARAPRNVGGGADSSSAPPAPSARTPGGGTASEPAAPGTTTPRQRTPGSNNGQTI